MTTYYEKLKSPIWQKKRLEILNDRGFVCESCLDDGEQLHVHHKIYKKGLNPWDYPDHNYAVLCDTCHKQEHEVIDKMNDLSGLLPIQGYFTQSGVYDFIVGFIDADEGWETVSDKQYSEFQNLARDEFDSFMFYMGVLAKRIVPYGRGKLHFTEKMKNLDLDEMQLCNLFTSMALNCSKIDAEKINKVREILGGKEI